MRHKRLISSSVGVLSVAGMLLASSSVQAGAAPQTKAEKARAAVEALHVKPLQRAGTKGGAVTQLGSYNWSGYGDGQVSGAPQYSAVSAQWVEPAVKCTSEDRIAAFWSGIDGLTSGTVEQDGTLAQCFEGTAFYYSWWEMYPTNSIQVVGTTVAPGDHITAAVTFSSPTTFALAVTDATTPANSFSTNQTCAASSCVRSSVEVIGERPSSSIGIYPLAQFGTWSVTNVTVSPGTITTPAEDEIQMVDGTDTYALAQPSAYKKAAKSFTDKWLNSY
jgi:hypothetical protein